nr:MAG TPA: hypothetical protein [Caudoviricetes sp.]
MSEWQRSKFQASAARQRGNFGHRNRATGLSLEHPLQGPGKESSHRPVSRLRRAGLHSPLRISSSFLSCRASRTQVGCPAEPRSLYT